MAKTPNELFVPDEGLGYERPKYDPLPDDDVSSYVYSHPAVRGQWNVHPEPKKDVTVDPDTYLLSNGNGDFWRVTKGFLNNFSKSKLQPERELDDAYMDELYKLYGDDDDSFIRRLELEKNHGYTHGDLEGRIGAYLDRKSGMDVIARYMKKFNRK